MPVESDQPIKGEPSRDTGPLPIKQESVASPAARPESPIAKDKPSTTIDRLRRELATTFRDRASHQNNPETRLDTNNHQPRPGGRLHQLTDRLLYPANWDSLGIFGNVLLPTLSTSIVLFGIDSAASFLSTTGKLAPDAANSIMRGSFTTGLAFYAASLVSAGFATYLASKEHLNRVMFSNLLTVSRVATSPDSWASQNFPIITSERFYGELHFTGKGIIPSPLIHPREQRAVVVDGITGIANLATACKNNDSKLGGINFFLGASPIIDKSLERFGFLVIPDHTSPTVMEQLAEKSLKIFPKIVGIAARVLRPRHSNASPIQESRHQSMMCLISREELLANQTGLTELAKKLQQHS